MIAEQIRDESIVPFRRDEKASNLVKESFLISAVRFVTVSFTPDVVFTLGSNARFNIHVYSEGSLDETLRSGGEVLIALSEAGEEAEVEDPFRPGEAVPEIYTKHRNNLGQIVIEQKGTRDRAWAGANRVHLTDEELAHIGAEIRKVRENSVTEEAGA